MTVSQSGVVLRSISLFLLLAAALLPGPFAATAWGDWTETGVASWYGPGFAGRPTASTEIYDPNALTAAHKSLPLGSLVRVENLENGRSLIVRINDRGPFVAGRIIDLSRASAQVLDFHDDGLTKVRIQLIGHQYPSRTRELARFQSTADDPASAETYGLMDDAAHDGVNEEVGVIGSVNSGSFGRSDPGFTASSLSPGTAGASEAAPSPPPSAPAPDSRAEPSAPREDPVAPLPAAPTFDEYTLQIGAFDRLENAWRIIKRADALGLTTAIQDGGAVYRALVGPFATVAEAREAQETLRDAGIDSFLREPSR